jgi:hypothetical protein
VESSAANASKDLLLPGITMTLGPGGIVAQPESINTTESMPTALFKFIPSSAPSMAGWNSIGHHLHPSARTGFDVGVVALGILTVVPITGFLLILLILLSIGLGLLLNDNRRR